MGKKAVYSNKGLQVYITGEDFEELLERGQIYLDVNIGKSAVPAGMGFVHLAPETIVHLANAFTLEQGAIDAARGEHFSGFGRHARTIMNSKDK